MTSLRPSSTYNNNSKSEKNEMSETSHNEKPLY